MNAEDSNSRIRDRDKSEEHYSQSIGEREVTFPSSDLDAVLTVLVTVALAHTIHGDPRCEFRGTPAPDPFVIED